jgi:hypothetical protein
MDSMNTTDAGRRDGSALERVVVPLLPRRVQLSRAPGWRMPENTVKVDRTTRWGNPFVVGRDGTQAECVEAFGWLAGEEASLDAMARVLVPPGGLRATETMLAELKADPAPLRGKNLACWCGLDKPCHADVLLRLVNGVRHNAEFSGRR